MDDFSESVMIVLLPTTIDWCKIELPHMTLVYAGEKKDLPQSAFNELAKDASTIAMLSGPLLLKVTGVSVFGDEDKVNVLNLALSSELLAMRRIVDSWNASEFPFNPHATIGPVNEFVENVPMVLRFDRIMVGWGKDQLTFWLKR